MTSADATVPVPFVIEQVSETGCVAAVTEYGVPDATAVAKAKSVALAAMLRVSDPFARTSPLCSSPLIVPPIVNVGAGSPPTRETVCGLSGASSKKFSVALR